MPDQKPRRTRPKPAQPSVHVRGRASAPPAGIRVLPDELNALAHGVKPRRPPPKAVLRDDRTEALVPGVANRDARAVCDARIERLLAARDGGDRDLLGQELAEAFRLGVWRGRNLTGFDALLDDVLGLRVADGRRLADAGARALGTPLVRAADRDIATWFRIEAGLIANPSAWRVELRSDGQQERFVISLPADRADLWLGEIGKRVVALSKFLPPPATPTRRPLRR